MEAADNKEHFENQWRQAFDQAGMAPPPMAWHKIEATLATQKEGVYKKTIFYYRLAAAAMATVAVGLGAALLFNSDEANRQDYRIASESVRYQNELKEETSSSATARPGQAGEEMEDVNASEKGSLAKGEPEAKSGMGNELPKGKEMAPGFDSGGSGGAPGLVAANEDHEQVKAASGYTGGGPVKGSGMVAASEHTLAEKDVFSLPGLTARPVAEIPTKVEVLSVSHLYGVARPVIRNKEASGDQPLLASVGLGAGSFDPNYSFSNNRNSAFLSGSGNADRTGFSVAPGGAETVSDQFNSSNGLSTQNARGYNENYNQGGAFSVGVGVGKRLFKRLLVHTGLYYGRFNSSGSTNLILTDSASDKRYAVNTASLYNEDVQNVYGNGNYSYRSEETGVTNMYEFLTVPMKVGFVLLDGRTGLVLNTGVSSEILLSNVVRPDGSGIEVTRNKAGDDSPYRNIYFNGTLGLEVNYQVASNYRVVVEPYYRHALTTFTKNSESHSSSPRIWGIQAGLRYELR